MDQHRGGDHRVGQGLGDFRLAAAGDGAGLVAEGAFRGRSYQPPALAGGRLDHLHLVAGRQHVGDARLERDFLRPAFVSPRGRLAVQVDVDVLRHVEDVRELLVDAVTLGLEVENLPVAAGESGELVVHRTRVVAQREILSQVEARERDRAAGMLFLRVAEEVRRVAELGFHLLLAVAVVVVRDDRHDDPALVAAGDLKRAAVVVELVRRGPAHALALLALGGVGDVRKPDVLLGQRDEMGREDHAAGVAGPMLGIEAGVVVRQERIAAVAENALHEVQVAHQIPRREEARFHRFLRRDPRHFRRHDRPQQQRDEDFRRLLARAGEGQRHDVRRRGERVFEQACEHLLRHGFLVRRHRQAALRHVENPLRRPPVVGRVVANPLMHPVGTQDRRLEFILIRRQRQHPGDPVALHDQRRGRQQMHGVRENLRHDFTAEIVAQKGVDRRVHRAKVVREQPRFFLEIRDQ